MNVMQESIMNTNLNTMFDEFNTTYDYGRVELNHETLGKAASLIQDEVDEVFGECHNVDFSKTDAVKEMLDTVYMTCQQLRAFGVDIDAGLAELHRSNLSKTVPTTLAALYMKELKPRYPYIEAIVKGDRTVLRCGETNKVAKPSCYSPAVITPEMING